jgi:outer membrane protein, heavy metal efflux system
MLRTLTVVALAGLLPACAVHAPRPPGQIADEIQKRAGHPVRPPDVRPTGDLPAGVTLDDGVTEDDAVATALWNNGQLSADLAALGVARANLLEAGLLRNPSLQVLFPVGAKPFELALTWPIDQLVQRPRRVAAATRTWEQVAEGLVQHGLNAARDARYAHAALVQAQERERLSAESAALRADIARMTEARLRAGDVSQAEVRAVESDAASAADQAARALHDVAIARERLRFQMGLPPAAAQNLRAVVPAVPRASLPPIDDLREAAWSRRPDLRAQELAVAAAAQRARWERSRWLVLAAILSTKEVGTQGVLSGPGVSADLPVFGTARGGVARADAEVEQASRQYVAMRQRVDLEVSEAREVLAQAEQSVDEHTGRVLPPLEEAAAAARRSYETGDVSYLFVVGVNRQLVDARLRLVDLEADVRRARAELDRSVGTRIETLKLP